MVFGGRSAVEYVQILTLTQAVIFAVLVLSRIRLIRSSFHIEMIEETDWRMAPTGVTHRLYLRKVTDLWSKSA